MGNEWLLHEERKVHIPDFRHLIEQNQCAFEKSVDLGVFYRVDGRIHISQMLNAKLKILCLRKPAVDCKMVNRLTIFHNL